MRKRIDEVPEWRDIFAKPASNRFDRIDSA
jgi:hypothetical protein